MGAAEAAVIGGCGTCVSTRPRWVVAGPRDVGLREAEASSPAPARAAVGDPRPRHRGEVEALLGLRIRAGLGTPAELTGTGVEQLARLLPRDHQQQLGQDTRPDPLDWTIPGEH